MLRKILLSTAAVAALAAPALAADLPARAAAPAPVYAAPIFTWTGFYVGAQVGYAWTEAKHTFDNGAPSGKSKSNGILGGLHAGYNHQIGAMVLGLEGDFDFNGAKGSFTDLTGLTSVGTSRINTQGSLRARLGFAMNNALLYVTGGWALADTRFGGGPAPLPATGGYSKTLSGWALGAGVEYAFTNNWTARAEYRYTDFGKSHGFLAPANPGVLMSNSTTQHAIRVGVTYKFGGPSAVVAKY